MGMHFDFGVGGKPAGDARLALDTIFHVLGDASYSTPRKEITPGKTYFVCTTQGAGELRYDGAAYLVRRGECLFARPKESFAYRCAQEAWHFWWFEFRGELPLLCVDKVLATPVNDFKINLFEQSLLYAKDERWDIAESLFEAACGMLHHTLLTQDKARDDALLHTARQYIQENMATVTVAGLGEALQLKERTLLNVFRGAFGQSPKQVITKMRMETAQQMLENTVLSVSEIAVQLGFSSPFHFSRAFRQAFGVPPKRYRRDGFDRQAGSSLF